MRLRLKKRLLRFIKYLYILFPVRFFCSNNKIKVIVFHKPSVKSFENVAKYLVNNYSIVSLQDVFNYKKISSATNRMIITFDDGHKSNFELLPIIKKYKLPVTIFLTTGIIGTNRHFWFIKKNELNKTSNLKKISNNERLKTLETIGFSPTKEFDEPQALSKEQIIEMSPYVDFQSHTVFHPILPMCDEETSRQEIFESKRMLEEEYGFNIYALAYPNGDYSAREMRLCKEAGYKMALTTESGFNDQNTDPFRLKRIGTNDTEDMNEFILRVSGVWHVGLKLKKLLMFWK
jgi:peptidoglycan/xylan/chitin deacetylase (PgdA/CDA1 family)